MASLTYTELVELVKYVVGDPQGDTFSAQHYSESIDFAIRQYATKTGATYTTTTAVMDASGYVTLPTDQVKVNRITLNGKQLIESTLSFLSEKSETWDTDNSALPKRWSLWSGNKAKLTPLMTTYSASTATIGYIQRPTIMSGTATVDPRIPESHNEFLKYAAAAYLLHLDGDNQSIPLADKLMETFNQLIGYEDPVLQYKQNLTRKMGKLEV